VGQDVGAIGSNLLFSFGSGWRLRIWLFALSFIFKLKSGIGYPAEGILFPHHRQYLIVGGNVYSPEIG